MLKKLDLIEELHFAEEHHHYEIKPSAGHHHLVCLGCGRVIEFHHPLSRYLKASVAEVKNFDITETEIRISGYCPECQRRRK